ncbi:hypothetical protein AcW2_006755 [Taiwanofungus camphoratus]|nr:hypothetical protein AcW2_006755 [Antrodia cinnamomea]
MPAQVTMHENPHQDTASRADSRNVVPKSTPITPRDLRPRAVASSSSSLPTQTALTVSTPTPHQTGDDFTAFMRSLEPDLAHLAPAFAYAGVSSESRFRAMAAWPEAERATLLRQDMMLTPFDYHSARVAVANLLQGAGSTLYYAVCGVNLYSSTSVSPRLASLASGPGEPKTSRRQGHPYRAAQVHDSRKRSSGARQTSPGTHLRGGRGGQGGPVRAALMPGSRSRAALGGLVPVHPRRHPRRLAAVGDWRRSQSGGERKQLCLRTAAQAAARLVVAGQGEASIAV